MSGLIADVRRFRLPLSHPLTTGRTSTTHRDGMLFSISDGLETGWGEATPMPGWSRESIGSVEAALRAAAATVSTIGDVSDSRLGRLLDDLDPTPHARAAVSGALADLRARRAGMTLAEMLDTGSPGSVRVNTMVSASTPEEVAAACSAAIKVGFESIKVKVGVLDPGTDVARVEAARSAMGSGPELRIDANGSWQINTALSVLEQVAQFDVSYCEEPVEGIAGIAAVGARSGIPVAVDESARTLGDVAEALATESIDVVVVKPQAIGGPDLAIRALQLARNFGATTVVTSMIDGAIGVSHALHVAAASGAHTAHGLATSSLLSADNGPAVEVANGRMSIGGAPGIGIEPFDQLPI